MTPRDTSLTSALAALSAGLDDPSIDVGQSLGDFMAAVRRAVPSYCGLSITMPADGVPVTITAPVEGDDDGAATREVVTSLVVPLSALSVSAADGELVLFASVAGAFVDLAADLAYATATELLLFELDTRLGSPVRLTVAVGGLSMINQAIGMLIENGYTPEAARARIVQIAANDGHDLTAAAHHIVSGEER